MYSAFPCPSPYIGKVFSLSLYFSAVLEEQMYLFLVNLNLHLHLKILSLPTFQELCFITYSLGLVSSLFISFCFKKNIINSLPSWKRRGKRNKPVLLSTQVFSSLSPFLHCQVVWNYLWWMYFLTFRPPWNPLSLVSAPLLPAWLSSGLS